MILTEKIEEILEPIAKEHNMEIVQINYARKTLQILLEKEDGTSPTIDECEIVSKSFSTLLDVENIINEKYYLEVSSAGMDRPLTKLKDYEKFLEKHIKLELKMPRNETDTRKQIKGKIKEVKGTKIYIETKLDKEEQIIEIEYDNINKAKLQITEEEIKEILKTNKKKGN